jgi:hypothetical protein
VHPLDRLFARMDKACAAYRDRYAEAVPSPSEASDEVADRLVDALHAVERAVDELDAFFAAPADG